MDKVELSVKDIEALLKWRDQHPQEIKSHPAPLKAVEIVMPHNGYRIKGIREGGPAPPPPQPERDAARQLQVRPSAGRNVGIHQEPDAGRTR